MREEVHAFAKKGIKPLRCNTRSSKINREVIKTQQNDYVGLEGEFRTIYSLNVLHLDRKKMNNRSRGAGGGSSSFGFDFKVTLNF